MCQKHFEEVRDFFAASRDASAVVYYVGDPAKQMIKIGTTQRLRHRFMQLATSRRKVILLATEPGSIAVEAARHRQFADVRVTGEWFAKSTRLLAHIGTLRERHGILLTGDGRLPPWAVAPLRSRNGHASSAGNDRQSDLSPQTPTKGGHGE